MVQSSKLKELSFLVYGLGLSGRSVINFFKRNSIKNFKVWDDNKRNIHKKYIPKNLIQTLNQVDYVILSPGISLLKNKNTKGEIINIGSGKPIKIKKLILKICKIIGSGKPNLQVALNGNDLNAGISISWEIFFEDRAREAIRNGGQILLNPTNGSSYWFKSFFISLESKKVRWGHWKGQLVTV